jgi:hypothetical protein
MAISLELAVVPNLVCMGRGFGASGLIASDEFRDAQKLARGLAARRRLDARDYAYRSLKEFAALLLGRRRAAGPAFWS